MVDSVNSRLLAEINVTIKDISEQIRISVGTEHEIVLGDIAFSRDFVVNI